METTCVRSSASSIKDSTDEDIYVSRALADRQAAVLCSSIENKLIVLVDFERFSYVNARVRLVNPIFV